MTASFANNGQSTLVNSMNSNVKSLTLSSTASFEDASGVPLAPPFTVQSDSELLSVTDVVGTTFTVVRGQEGTSAASHSALAVVKAVTSAGGLQALPRPRHVGTATPTGGVSGDRAISSGRLWVNDAGTWKAVNIA
jgi:hypothetical protein